MFRRHAEEGYRPVLEGIVLKTLAHGEKTLLAEFRMRQGSVLPQHEHPHEQTGYLVSGHMRLHVGDETYEAVPGDSWCIPGNVRHGADILADTVAVEVFSPVREDYLPGEATA